MFTTNNSLILTMQKSIDICLVSIAFVVAYFVKLKLLPGFLRGLTSTPNYYIVLLLIIIIWYICFQWMGMYISYRQSTFWQFFVLILKSSLMSFLLLNITLYLVHLKDISRLLMILFFVFSIILLTIEKFVIYTVLKKIRADGSNLRNILVVGCRKRAIDLINAIDRYPDSGYNILGCIDLDDTRQGQTVTGNHRIIGSLPDLEAILIDNVVDELVFALKLDSSMNAGHYIALAENMGVKVRILPDWQIQNLMYQPGIANIHVTDLVGLYTLTLQSTPDNEGKLFIKLVGDYLLAGTAAILFLPLMITTGVLIKLLSEGPVFYKQERLGLNGRRFILYKFRTMVNNADKLKKDFLGLNEADGPVFKLKNDPRIIPWIGKFLRRTSLDELPQIFNVLKGEMSIVGPRPPIPSEADEYSVWQRRRLSMKPGLTCYWQVAPNRHELSFNEWMNLDLKYIDNWSLLNDLKIILLTVKTMVSASGR